MDGLISRLNKIDDNNSLRMRTTPESCKPQKYLREDTDDTVDTEGLEACMEKVVKEVIRTLRLDVSVKSVTGHLWRDRHHPLWNNWHCKIIAEKGANTIIRSWQNSPEPTVYVNLYDLPKNCQITETLILERYKEAIAKELLNTFISLDVWKEREVLYDQREMEISKIIDRLESKYRSVTLQYELIPSMEGYCSVGGLFSGIIDIDVCVRAISGKSGSLRVNSRSDTRLVYGKYTVDGKTTQVCVWMSPHHSLGYYRSWDDVDLAEWEREVSLNIEEFIKLIDAIDYAVKNEASLEKQLNEYLMKLQKYYPDATLSAVKKCDVNTLGSFVIYYTGGNYPKNVCTISIEELVDFDDAKKQIRYALKTLRRKIR